MQNFGDFLPKDLKEGFASTNLKVGAVLRYEVPFTTPPKVKRLIVVGFDAEKVLFASVLINTEINPNIFDTPEKKALHHELDSNGRPYLDHTSFVDCSELFEQDVEIVKEKIVSEISTHSGELSETDLETIINKIKTAKTISVKAKRKFGLL